MNQRDAVGDGEEAAVVDGGLALSILERLPTPLCLRDRQSRYVWANAAFRSAFGRARSELLGKTDFDLLPHEQALLEQLRDERVVRDGQDLFFEDRASHPSTLVGLSGWHLPVRRSDQGPVEYVLRQWGPSQAPAAGAPLTPDADESVRLLKEQQSELLKKERLIVLGQLAGSLAHQIRNPLGAISNAVAVLRRQLSGQTTPAMEQALDIAQEEVWVANRIIADLLAYSRIRPPAQRGISVRELVETVLGRETVPEGVTIDRRLGSERVYVDSGQVADAIANVIRNACEAMDGQGTLTIASRRNEESVELTIADTGVGISQEEIALLFEPLITSKALGIGLGLTTARALVVNQGGTLECEGEPGKGARFKLRLPPAGEPGDQPASAPVGAAETRPAPGGAAEEETMLIDRVKQRMFQAMKAGSTVEKEVLRTAIGEVTRSGDEPTDERVVQVMKKLVKTNQETLAAATSPEQRSELEQEIAVLQAFLPELPGPDQLRELLAPVADAIRAAAGPGPAMGIAMKHLKTAGVAAEARDVQAAANELRK